MSGIWFTGDSKPSSARSSCNGGEKKKKKKKKSALSPQVNGQQVIWWKWNFTDLTLSLFRIFLQTASSGVFLLNSFLSSSKATTAVFSFAVDDISTSKSSFTHKKDITLSIFHKQSDCGVLQQRIPGEEMAEEQLETNQLKGPNEKGKVEKEEDSSMKSLT